MIKFDNCKCNDIILFINNVCGFFHGCGIVPYGCGIIPHRDACSGDAVKSEIAVC